jgi:hypothetical protein
VVLGDVEESAVYAWRRKPNYAGQLSFFLACFLAYRRPTPVALASTLARHYPECVAEGTQGKPVGDTA